MQLQFLPILPQGFHHSLQALSSDLVANSNNYYLSSNLCMGRRTKVLHYDYTEGPASNP